MIRGEIVVQIIQIVLSGLTLIFTILIPFIIKWEQLYSSLLDEFRGFDYAIAYQGVVQFFVNECNSDMDQVKEAYKTRFLNEIETEDPENIKKENCLHFQRRLLAQFFWQLNKCAKCPLIRKSRIAKDFSKSEAKLLKILIYMGQGIEEDEMLYKDISSSAILKNANNLKGQNKSLREIYDVLKKSKR